MGYMSDLQADLEAEWWPAPEHDDACRDDDCPGQSIERYALSGEPVNVGCPCWCHETEPEACPEHRAGCPAGAH